MRIICLQRVGIQQDGYRPVILRVHLHIGPKFPVLYMETPGLTLRYEPLIEGNGGVRPGGAGEAGTPGFAVGIEGELGDHQQRAAGLGQIQVHFAVFILKNSQAADLVGQLIRLGLGVQRGHS